MVINIIMSDLLNTVILYNEYDSESFEFAKYYADSHNISYSNCIPVPCSFNEILSDYSQFQLEIENPLLEYLSNYDEYYELDLRYILVGYNVPGGFYDGLDIISTTSRLARMNHVYSKKEKNPIFNRKSIQDYSYTDAFNALIVSRIDAEDLATAKTIVNNSEKIRKQNLVNGKFYFDKYAIIEDELDLDYYDSLVDFEDNVLSGLNITTEKTEFWDEYTDVPIFKLQKDSFMWAWKTNTTSESFFETTNTSRVFLYNGDSDSAESLRTISTQKFCPLALYSGYGSCSGALSDPGVDAFLKPFPFFQYLSLGRTIGESFNYSVPYFNWTIGLFGDPLICVRFPDSSEIDLEDNVLTDYLTIHDEVADCIGYAWSISNNINDIRDALLTEDWQTKYDMFNFIEDKASSFDVNSEFKKISSNFIEAYNSKSIDTFLNDNGLKISENIVESSGADINDTTVVITEGSWVLESSIVSIENQYDWFNFELEISAYDDFSDIALSVNTEDSLDGWEFEKYPNIFETLPIEGVTTSFAGRRIRYSSEVLFTRGDVFWFRIRQKSQDNEYTDWVSIKKVINT